MIIRQLKNGFTVAEIVVSMFIITGIAMLMLPTLINDSEKQTISAGLNKSYTQLQQVAQSIGLMQARGKLTVGATPINTFWNAIPLLMKIVPTAKNDEYIPNSYRPANLPNAIGIANPNNNAKVIVLKSGIYIFKDTTNNYILVDVNGRRQPNRLGRDIFFFSVTQNPSTRAIGITPVINNNCNLAGNNASDTYGCANRIINIDNGRITYY